jgi:Mg2+ and Co2+ transporter CorA
VAVIEAQADATADVIEAQAEAEVEIIEALSEAPEWRDQLYQDVTRLQEESSRATAEQIAALRTDMMTGLAMLSERMDQLIQTSPPTEQVPPNPDPGQSEATSGNGSAAEQPASENAAEIVEEPAKEPDKPERRRAHRWI